MNNDNYSGFRAGCGGIGSRKKRSPPPGSDFPSKSSILKSRLLSGGFPPRITRRIRGMISAGLPAWKEPRLTGAARARRSRSAYCRSSGRWRGAWPLSESRPEYFHVGGADPSQGPCHAGEDVSHHEDQDEIPRADPAARREGGSETCRDDPHTFPGNGKEPARPSEARILAVARSITKSPSRCLGMEKRRKSIRPCRFC